jgi:hypothetical protein
MNDDSGGIRVSSGSLTMPFHPQIFAGEVDSEKPPKNETRWRPRRAEGANQGESNQIKPNQTKSNLRGGGASMNFPPK